MLHKGPSRRSVALGMELAVFDSTLHREKLRSRAIPSLPTTWQSASALPRLPESSSEPLVIRPVEL